MCDEKNSIIYKVNSVGSRKLKENYWYDTTGNILYQDVARLLLFSKHKETDINMNRTFGEEITHLCEEPPYNWRQVTIA